MTMRDADQKGRLFWQVKEWDLTNKEEQKIELPADMLSCRAISREIVFFSKPKIENFSIVQVMQLHGQTVEQLSFKFGFVIPNSTNSWDQTIEADVGQVMPAEVLSGNLVVKTYFLSGE